MTDVAKIYMWLHEIDFVNNIHYCGKNDDISAADAFYENFKNDLRYCTTTREWYRYRSDIGVWEPGADAVVAAQCKSLARAMLQYSADVQREFQSSQDADDEGKQKRIEKFARWTKSLQNLSARQRMERDARSLGCFRTSDLDNRTDLFNCKDGVVCLAEGPHEWELLPHNPAYLMTKCSGVEAYGERDGARWETFLDEVTQNDNEVKKYLQKILGSCLEFGNPDQELYVLFGPSSRNGKTSLAEAVANVFGDYAVTADPATFGQSSRGTDPSKPRSDIANLVGARLIRCPEPSRGLVLDASLLKALTGGNQLSTRELYGKEFSFRCGARIFFDSNHLPRITDQTLFASDRVAVVPFTRHFSVEERDVNLSRVLQSPKSATYIFWWLAQGLADARKTGLKNRPDAVQKATIAYAESSDKTGMFIRDILMPDAGAAPLAIKKLYSVFEDWCADCGMSPIRKSAFIQDLKTRDMFSQTATINGKTVRNTVKGFSLTDEGKEYFNRYI